MKKIIFLQDFLKEDGVLGGAELVVGEHRQDLAVSRAIYCVHARREPVQNVWLDAFVAFEPTNL